MKKTATAIILILSTVTQAAPNNQAQIFKQVSDARVNVMGKCSVRMWPDYSWKNLTLALVGNDESQAVSPHATQARRVPQKNLPDGARGSTFSFFYRLRSPWMSVRGDWYEQLHLEGSAAAQALFGLAVHEGFHKLVQPKWKAGSSSSRGTEYPIQVMPRLERRMIYDQLREAFLKPENAPIALAKASFWFHKWQSEFPLEATATTDGYEGTARYVEYIAMALMQDGCGASEEQLRARLIENFDEKYGAAESGQIFELDTEGYDIGSLAALILRFGYPNRNWWPEIAQGRTPPQILLDGIAPQSSEIDATLKSTFEASQARIQQRASELIQPALTSLKSPKTVILAIPSNWLAGSYSPFGFYIDTASRKVMMPLAEAAQFASPHDPSSKILIKDHAVFIEGLTDSPCSQLSYFWTLPISAESVAVTVDGFAIADEHAQGTLKATQLTGHDGRVWICGATAARTLETTN